MECDPVAESKSSLLKIRLFFSRFLTGIFINVRTVNSTAGWWDTMANGATVSYQYQPGKNAGSSFLLVLLVYLDVRWKQIRHAGKKARD